MVHDGALRARAQHSSLYPTTSRPLKSASPAIIRSAFTQTTSLAGAPAGSPPRAPRSATTPSSRRRRPASASSRQGMRCRTAGSEPSLQITSRSTSASTGVPGLGPDTDLPVSPPSFAVGRSTGPQGRRAPETPVEGSSASTTPAPRRVRLRRRSEPLAHRHVETQLPRSGTPKSRRTGLEPRRRRHGRGALRCAALGRRRAKTGRPP